MALSGESEGGGGGGGEQRGQLYAGKPYYAHKMSNTEDENSEKAESK